MLLALTLCLSLSTTAFASETSEIPENVTKTTVTYTVDAGESVTTVQPRIWNQESHTVGVGYTVYGLQFTIPDRYFAFEVYATDSNGNAVNASYTVALVYDITSVVSTITGTANGTVYKNDWIDLSYGGKTHQFRYINLSSTALSVHVTYYSWA